MGVPKQKPGKSKQNYCTPMKFIEAVHRALIIKEFAIDLAADSTNAVAVKYYSELDNALYHSWEGIEGWAWCNPPYSDITPWVKKASEECVKGTKIALLVPASVGSNWWRDYVHKKAQIYFLNGRLAFMRDKPKWLYPKDCALLLYGEKVTPMYMIWNWREA